MIVQRLYRFGVVGLVVGLLGAGAPGVSGAPVVIDAIVPSTGGGAFLATAYINAFRAIEILTNETGGIRGRPLKIATVDSQTSAQLGVQIVNGFIAKHDALFIDGGPSTVCNASVPLVDKAGPVDYCLSPLVKTTPFGYVFSASTGASDIINVGVRNFRLRGWKRLAMITSTDATGSDYDAKTMQTLALPENKDVQLVARERFGPADVSVSAQIARIVAAKPDAILLWTTGTPVATALRAISDAGLDVPVQIPSSNLIYAQLAAYEKFLPKRLFFPTLLASTPEGTPAGPIRDAQAAYVKSLKAVGVRPDFATNLPWDPTIMLIDALRKFGPDASAAAIHDYLVHLHGWVGIDGVYDMSDGGQRGIGENAEEMAQWDAAKHTWVRASRPHGYLL